MKQLVPKLISTVSRPNHVNVKSLVIFDIAKCSYLPVEVSEIDSIIRGETFIILKDMVYDKKRSPDYFIT